MQIINSASVASLMNTILANVTGQTDNNVIVSESLDNLVDVGTIISDNITAENFRNTATGMFDQIGEIVYSTIRNTTLGNYNINVSDTEYASIREKVTITPLDFEASHHWNTSGGSTFSDMFEYHNLEFTTKVYNKLSNFRTKPYSLGINRFKSAFRSESEVMKMFGEIANMITAVYTYTVQAAEKRVVNQLVASTVCETTPTRCINLLEQYASETGETLTTKTCMKNDAFIRWAFAYMNKIADLMSMPTANYNDGSRIINTIGDDMRKVMITDFKRLIDTNVMSSAYNPEYISDNSWIITPAFQNATERNKIDIVPAGTHSITSGKHVTRVQINNIIGMIFDKRGACTSSTRIKTGTSVNDFDEHINYIHKFDMREFVDETENAVIFVLADYSSSSSTWTKAYTVTEAND